ncbi:MAG TPA: hypothetical protein DFR83_16700 [Deltaproteobacteria bacterium]|nr:hypothetical protein [Deltaproteobacteria bacterium]
MNTLFPAHRALIVVLIGATSCVQSQDKNGRTLFVQPAADGEWDDPDHMQHMASFTTIQDAIDAASSGDVVSVPSGTYIEDIDMADGVTVNGAGSGETLLVGTVTFDGLSAASLANVGLYDATYVATGVANTETGIYVNGGSATIENIEAYYFNYAIHGDGAASLDVDSVEVGANWYGIVADGVGSLSVTNSFVYSNSAGGVVSELGTAGSILHNTFIGNGFGGSSAYLTGAVSMGSGGSEVVANNIMVSNYYGLNCYSCSSSWSTNLIWGNVTDYVNDASQVSTDLSVDPQFKDYSEGDYSLGLGSPCIDAGSATYGIATDRDGEARPQGAGYDIGMDEFASTTFDLIITEVMANASTESTGEFVEIYNNGATAVDLSGLILTDGDDIDTLQAYGSSSTTLAAGEYAVVLDPDYASDYTIDSAVTLLTTGDTTVGNGLTTADDITLYEADGSTIIATFRFPADPGDGVSMEMYSLENGDASGNWRASQCADGSSPGAEACFPESGDPADLIITEVMANALSESTGEYVELYNAGTSEIDLSGLVISDGDSSDTLEAFASGSTLLAAGQHALILDSAYSYDYVLPVGVVLMSAGSTIGNGLAVSDPITLFDTDGTTTIDSFGHPADPGDGFSIEKVDYAVGDDATNWDAGTTSCTLGRSPGRLNGAASGLCGPLLITEVMANAGDEDTGEFIELYNAGAETIDLAGLVFSDGDAFDTLQAYDSGSTTLAVGAYAVIVDAEFDGDFTIDSAATVVTTTDTTLGNSLAVSDTVTLYEADGTTILDQFLYPQNPGNAVSVERVAYWGDLDTSDNWESSTCASGSSPGLDNCVSGSSSAAAESSVDILITEIMANADTESTGEFIELYNNGTTDVDMLYWVVYDGDAVDTILGFSDPFDTILEAGEYAIILDADYAGEYPSIPSDTLILTTDDSTIGSGLATSDPIYIFEDNAISLVDSFSYPDNPGNAVSIERQDISTGDEAANWSASNCSTGSSPGQGTCP